MLFGRRMRPGWGLNLGHWASHALLHMALEYRQILLPWYLRNSLSSLDEIYSEYSLAPTDDLIRFWRSKVKVTAGRRGWMYPCQRSGIKVHLVVVVAMLYHYLNVYCALHEGLLLNPWCLLFVQSSVSRSAFSVRRQASTCTVSWLHWGGFNVINDRQSPMCRQNDGVLVRHTIWCSYSSLLLRREPLG